MINRVLISNSLCIIYRFLIIVLISVQYKISKLISILHNTFTVFMSAMKYNNTMSYQLFIPIPSYQRARLFTPAQLNIYIENCVDLSSVVDPASFSYIEYKYSDQTVTQSNFAYLKKALILINLDIEKLAEERT